MRCGSRVDGDVIGDDDGVDGEEGGVAGDCGAESGNSDDSDDVARDGSVYGTVDDGVFVVDGE